RIVLRINTNRVEEEVLADSLAQDLLQLAQLRGLQGTHVPALGEDDVDGDRLAFEQVVVETDMRSILRRENNVGEIVCPPAVVRTRRTEIKKADEHRGNSHDARPKLAAQCAHRPS